MSDPLLDILRAEAEKAFAGGRNMTVAPEAVFRALVAFQAATERAEWAVTVAAYALLEGKALLDSIEEFREQARRADAGLTALRRERDRADQKGARVMIVWQQTSDEHNYQAVVGDVLKLRITSDAHGGHIRYTAVVYNMCLDILDESTGHLAVTDAQNDAARMALLILDNVRAEIQKERGQ